MPHVIVSTQIRLAVGPCRVGDGQADPELMEVLEAKRSEELGNFFAEYVTEWPARQVLDKLESLGYKVVGMAGMGQTCAWTLHKPST